MNLQAVRMSARVVAAAAEVTLRQNVVDAFVLFTILLQPLVIAVLAMWMLGGRGSENAIFVVIGSGMTGLWSSLLFMGGNSINWERWTGTLELLVGQPSHMSLIVFGKNLAVVLQSLGSMLASYALAAAFFQAPLHIAQPLLFGVSLVLMVISFVCFGLVIAPIFLMNPQVHHWQNAMEFPVYMLSGFLFPIALLPGWTTPLSYLLTPYWAARALHGTSGGTASSSETLLCWGMMILLAVVYAFVSRWLMDVMLRKARADATLRME